MRILGFEISRPKNLTAVDNRGGGGNWLRLISEPFSGAWQSSVTVDAPRQVTAFSAVFASVTIIAQDVAKLRIKLVELTEGGIFGEVTDSPFLPVLRKPNRFQTRIKFIENWIVSKLLHGNTYALKQRDRRGIVVALYILDPLRVKPLVAEDGDVFYELSADHLSGLTGTITVPASEIIHDTMVCLWHPLVGVSPIYACGVSATMGNRIQANSTAFFNNMSRPSGILSAPGSIDTEDAARLKTDWEKNFTGGKTGRVAVLGSGLKYEAMAVAASDAQLIEQLRWTVEDVARCFHIPIYKIGGAVPPGNNVETLNQVYYSDCLQSLIESLELCLDEGLGVRADRKTEVDLDGLLRMDRSALVKSEGEAVKAAISSPNESRRKLNLPPVEGGESPYLQQQNYPLADLKKRSEKADPFSTTPAPAPAPEPTDDDDDDETDTGDFAQMLIRGFSEHAAV